MKMRIIAMVLCLVMMIPMFSGCSNEVVESQLQVYLSHQIYDLDPLNAFTNDAQAKVVSLLFAGLYKLDEDGNVKPDLVKKATVTNDDEKKEYILTLTLNDTCWSDGSAVQASDIIYTFQRVLKANKSSDAAALLFKIKNAVAVKNGDVSIDDLGVYAVGTKEIEIEFDDEITKEDLEQFQLNLTSPALFPVREMNVEGKDDWAKKQTSMVFSGPFLLRKVSYTDGNKQLVLERNSYYYRNREKDAEDKYVTPFKLIINYEVPAEQQIDLYNNKQVLYVGEIPYALRSTYKSQAELIDTLSTHTYYFNQNALVASTAEGEENGFALFAIKEVRQALSLVIDRQGIANHMVYGKAATGLVSNKVFSTITEKKTFRDKCGAAISTSPNKGEAERLIAAAGIVPSNYSFSISVREADTAHLEIAQLVAESWRSLGFNVTVKPVGVVVNDEKDPVTKEDVKDIRDDLYEEDCVEAGKYEVLALDLVAKSPSAFSVLAPFAVDFTGNLTVQGKDTVVVPHSTGYMSEAYNDLITKAFNATNADDITEYLKQAEKMLLVDDAIVAPILFNQNAILINDELKGLKLSYYGFHYFTNAKYKDWVAYRDLYFPEETEESNNAPTEDPAGGAA